MNQSNTVTAVNSLSGARLRDLAFESCSQERLAAALTADNASHPIAQQILSRAANKGWNDVLTAAAESPYLIGEDFARIIRATDDRAVHLAVLESVPASKYPVALDILHGETPHAEIRAAAEARIRAAAESAVRELQSTAADALDMDEGEAVTWLVSRTLNYGWHDLTAAVIRSGHAGDLTAYRALRAYKPTRELHEAVMLMPGAGLELLEAFAARSAFADLADEAAAFLALAA